VGDFSFKNIKTNYQAFPKTSVENDIEASQSVEDSSLHSVSLRMTYTLGIKEIH